MVEKLHNIINDNVRYLYKNYGTCERYEADSILSLMEQAGMLPPFSGQVEQVNIEDRWGRDTGQTELTRVFKTKWEPENE